MFSKDDYKEYFQQIAGVERLMIYNVQDLLILLDDQELKYTLRNVASDESRHYGYIKEIFDSILFQDEAEKRRFIRIHSLGRVKIKIKGKDGFIEAYCVNISPGGICIESNQKINPQDTLELWVDFFNGREPGHHFGTLLWRAEIGADLQIESIRYQAGVRFNA
ncbi:MAG: PilZ domain-containing protein [Candidatus Omnitrophota bacterium]|nr:PilZ domain-containing protein [Candidatus Omnitrophota bacterium]